MKHVHAIAIFRFALVVLIGCVASVSAVPVPIASGYFTGSGGSGMRLAILVPENVGLSENQAYLPRLIQGGLVSNFSRHSAISVLDRVSLDRVIAETLDPTYEDNFDIVRLGHVAQVSHMMTGNVMRTSAGYVLQINVTDTTPSANTIASYSGLHAFERLSDFSAVNNASMELLGQMGVQLTPAAISRLNQASAAQDIGAQTSLAQGIVAQQRGTIVEALVHYHNAISFDPGLLEASNRLSVLSAHVSSGNIGQDVRNEIRWRNEWVQILAEAENFFTSYLPFELVYSTTLSQGRIDFARETVELTVPLTVRASSNCFNILSNITAGLEATGRREQWALHNWPFSDRNGVVQNPWEFRNSRRRNYTGIFSAFNSTFVRSLTAYKYLEVTAVLLGENGDAVSSAQTARGGFRIAVRWHDLAFRNFDNNRGQWRPEPIWDRTRVVAQETMTSLRFTVNANDITDRMTVQIVSVNGVNVTQNPNFIRIIAEN